MRDKITTHVPSALPAKRPLIMGIVNVTPDSFSGDGLLTHEDFVTAAVDQAVQMLKKGADILDIGGESSRPGSTPVSADEEIRRVVPVIRAIKQKCPDSIIAVDTIKASVAEAALDAGATIINDIAALQHDPSMAALAAARKATVVLMDNRSQAQRIAHDPRLGSQYQATESGDIVADVKRHLQQRIDFALAAGIAPDKIMIDPGLGFGKTVEQNLSLARACAEFKDLGYSVLIGPSRKSFIGRLLDAPVDNRLEGTAALVAISAFLGADVIRVHDVEFMSRVAMLAATVMRSP